MPSRADVERFADANRNIRALVLAELERLWRGLDTQNADATRDLLLEAVPLLVEQYGEISSTVAADFYDALRDGAKVSSRFTATVASADLTELAGQIRWSLGPIYSSTRPDPDAALGRLSQKVDEFTLQYGRDTIAANASRDPAKPRWARVPMGDTCKFCISLASRGAVFESYESARYKKSGGKYHGDCDCQPVAMFDGTEYPEGYDPDALYQQYRDARDAAGTGQLKPVLAKMREQIGGH